MQNREWKDIPTKEYFDRAGMIDWCDRWMNKRWEAKRTAPFDNLLGLEHVATYYGPHASPIYVYFNLGLHRVEARTKEKTLFTVHASPQGWSFWPEDKTRPNGSTALDRDVERSADESRNDRIARYMRYKESIGKVGF